MQSKQEQRPVIAFVISDISQAISIEAFALSYLSELYELHFFLLNAKVSVFEENLRKLPVVVHVLPNFGWRSQPGIVFRLYRHFRKLKPCAVHSTLLFANLSGLLAAKLAGVKNRIHNRHHSDPYHFRNLHAQLYDRIAQRLSTKIVVTSENVGEVLREREGVPAEKIVRIPFGVKVEDFENVPEARRSALRDSFRIEGRTPIVGMVSRLLEVKGLQYAIPAFRDFLREHPKACLLLARGVGGPYSEKVAELLRELPPEAYRDIPLVRDMPAFYSLVDIFVHVPISRRGEASGQAYTEALAGGCASVFTLSGIAPEFVRDSENALVVPFADAPSIADALHTLAADPALRRRLGESGREEVRRLYPMRQYLEAHEALVTAGLPQGVRQS